MCTDASPHLSEDVKMTGLFRKGSGVAAVELLPKLQQRVASIFLVHYPDLVYTTPYI